MKALKTGLLSLALMFSSQAAMAEKITVKPNASYQGVENKLSSGGKYFLFAGLHEIAGKAAVCGLVYYETKSATSKQLERKFSKQIQFHVDGKVLNVTSEAFARYDDEAQAKDGKAACSVSNLAWSGVKDAKSFKIKFPKRVTVID